MKDAVYVKDGKCVTSNYKRHLKTHLDATEIEKLRKRPSTSQADHQSSNSSLETSNSLQEIGEDATTSEIHPSNESFTATNSSAEESFFRLARSYTSVESTEVNFTIKPLIFRIQKIQLEEVLMHDLAQSLKLKFSNTIQREKKIRKKKANFSKNEIESVIEKAMHSAKIDANKLGMNCDELTPAQFLKVLEATIIKQVGKKSQSKPSGSNVAHNEEEDTLNVATPNDAENSSISFSLDNLEFTEKSSSKCKSVFYYFIVSNFIFLYFIKQTACFSLFLIVAFQK